MPARRRVLGTLGAVGALGVSAGCSALASPSATIHRIRLESGDSTAREFELAVAVDGETRYEETHTVPPDDDPEPMPELTGELPDESGRPTVETAVRGTDATRSSAFADDRCYDVIAEYTGEHVTHWRHAGDECEPTTDPGRTGTDQ